VTQPHLHVGSPRRAAVLGSPVGHSLSPVLHAAAHRLLGLDWVYGACEVDEAGLPAFLAGLTDEWVGLSLTMPLKRAAVELCGWLSDTARGVGGVNTITFADGVRRGDNTDVPGMVNALAEAGVGPVATAAVLGGGATAASAVAALSDAGASEVHAFVRSAGRGDELSVVAEAFGVRLVLRSWDEAAEALRFPLVVATTPGGSTDDLLVPAGRSGVLFDVAYDPWPTALAAAWTRNGGRVLGGLDLLVHQAVLQVELMTGGPVSRGRVLDAMRAAGEAALARRDGPGAGD